MHLRGSAGALAYNLYLAGSSGAFAATGERGTGSGYGFGLAYQAGGMTLGLDYSSAAVACNADGDAAATSCADDRLESKYGVALTVAGFGAHYYSGTTDVGGTAEETTSMDVVYLVEVPGGTVGPEYRIAPVSAGGTETTDSFLLFGMNMGF